MVSDRSDVGEADGQGGGAEHVSNSQRDDDDDYSDNRSDDDDRESHDSASRRAQPMGEVGRFGRQRQPRSMGLRVFFERLGSTTAEYIRCLCLGHTPVYSDLSMIYLIKVYMLTLAIFVHLVLVIAASRVYATLLPPLLLVHFDVEEMWTYRFQLLTLQLTSVCLLAVTTLATRLWPRSDLSTAHFDRVFLLAIMKHERHSGASAKSDDIIAMLEEESDAFVRTNLRAPSVRDE